MLELRKDYILNRWVIIAESRADRPLEFEKVTTEKEGQVCYFCPGNENLTPPETGRIEEDGSWIIRWFPNKFPAATLEKPFALTGKGFTKRSDSYGCHEVIAETPNHEMQLADMPVPHIIRVLTVYAQRITYLQKKKGIQYVQVFKNHGRDAGTSLIHSHSQLVALPIVPPAVDEEMRASGRYPRCPYCSIIRQEQKSPRKIFENESCIALAPYASRFHYEAWIFPKRHVGSITEMKPAELEDMASILKQLLQRLKSINTSYNYYLHYAPRVRPSQKKLHFHIELIPRLSLFAGLEYGSGITLNSVSPETAVRFYQDTL